MPPPPGQSETTGPTDESWPRPWEPPPLVTAPARVARPDSAGGLCPVDRLSRRRRNQLCILVIALGLLNWVVYTLAYAMLGGDAHNGHREVVVRPDGTRESVYYIRGHFLRSLEGHERAVSRGTWLYSYVHSISIPLTSGAMLISMLVLARPHILATMRGGFISGETFVAAFGTIIVLATAGATCVIAWNFVAALTSG